MAGDRVQRLAWDCRSRFQRPGHPDSNRADLGCALRALSYGHRSDAHTDLTSVHHAVAHRHLDSFCYPQPDTLCLCIRHVAYRSAQPHANSHADANPYSYTAKDRHTTSDKHNPTHPHPATNKHSRRLHLHPETDEDKDSPHQHTSAAAQQYSRSAADSHTAASAD
jgi:hypothetical protein